MTKFNIKNKSRLCVGLFVYSQNLYPLKTKQTKKMIISRILLYTNHYKNIK